MTADQASPSGWRRRLDIAETALLAAIFALVPEWVLLALLVPPLHEGFHGGWGWALRLAIAVPPFLTPLAAAVAGSIVAGWTRPGPVWRWVLIGVGARAAVFVIAAPLLFLPGPQGPVRWVLFCLVALVLSVAAAAYPVPMMWAIIARAIVFRGRARMVARIALVILVVSAIAVWAWFVAAGAVERAKSIADLSVSPTGRVYAATGAGIFAGDARDETLLYLRCGAFGRPAATVVADARNAMLVWAGLQVANRLTTELFQSDDAGKTWHPATGLPSDCTVLSTSSADYAYDAGFATLWVNRSGKAGDWRKRPVRLPKLQADGRVRILRKVLTASSQHPGLLMLVAECNIAGVGGQETWRGALYRSRDYGETWEMLNIPLLVEGAAAEQIDDVAIIPARPEVVVIATWWGTAISADEGGHWRRIKRPQGEHPKVVAAPTVPPTIYLLIEDSLYASLDLGLSWRLARSGVSCVGVSPADPRTIYAGSWQGEWWDRAQGKNVQVAGGLYRSRDSGETWRPIEYSLPRLGFLGR
jgi:hypothetical protein